MSRASSSLHPLALALLTVGSAQAQQATTAPQPGVLPTMVVTATARDQAVQEAPASISVITREQLDAKPYTSLQEVVRELEGVSIVGGSPNETDISIRGMPGEYTLLLVDGRRQNTRETMNRGTGGVQANLIPPLAAIERIEVVRGPMSSLYGADAIGGVVNIILRKPPAQWSGALSLGRTWQQRSELGDTTSTDFWIGGPVKEGIVGLQLYGKKLQRDEDRVYYPLNATAGAYARDDQSLTARLTITPTPEQDIDIEVGREDLNYRTTPGRTSPTTVAATTVLRTLHERDHWAVTHNGRWSFGTTKIALYGEEGTQTQFRSAGQNPVAPELSNQVLDGLLTLPFSNNVLKLGGQLSHNTLKGIAAQDAAPGGYGANVNRVRQKSWALFAEDEFFLSDRFTVTGGLRVDDDERYGKHWTPRLYGVYQLTPQWTLRGGAARGFKAPTIRQSTTGYCMTTGGQAGAVPGTLCGDSNLKPETSNSVEFGLRFDEGATSYSAMLFHNAFRNKVASYDTGVADPRSAGRNIYVYDNVDRVTLQGLELAAQAPLARGWTLGGSYTYTDSQRKGGGEPAFNGSSLEGRPLDKTPRHMFHAQLDWEPSDALSLYAAAHFAGKQYWAAFRNGAAGVRERASSTSFDLGGRYAFHKHLSLKVALLNITDKVVPVDARGRTTGLDGNWMVDEGRRLSVSLDAKF